MPLKYFKEKWILKHLLWVQGIIQSYPDGNENSENSNSTVYRCGQYRSSFSENGCAIARVVGSYRSTT